MCVLYISVFVWGGGGWGGVRRFGICECQRLLLLHCF